MIPASKEHTRPPEYLMPFPAITVLASARDAFRVTDGLRAAGMAAGMWTLPEECNAREAAALAELAAAGEEWSEHLTECRIIITAFRNPAILSSTIIPYVLPHLAVGSVWLQMGPVTQEEAHTASVAATEHHLSLVSAPLSWNPDGTAVQRTPPNNALQGGKPIADADASLLYGLTLAALTAPGLGLTPPAPMPRHTAETLARLELELASAPLHSLPADTRPTSAAALFGPLSELDLAELEAGHLAAPPHLPLRGGTIHPR
ncbi:NAD(P)-binding domain-containing protein [Streptomyces sp. NPDC004647]|uniref:NAD(P)-binding domain-containing protein n=1 Tax=Streptomyces sp. NPDC004647 TaxID=3154671 RepID=UPI0033BD7D86